MTNNCITRYKADYTKALALGVENEIEAVASCYAPLTALPKEMLEYVNELERKYRDAN